MTTTSIDGQQSADRSSTDWTVNGVTTPRRRSCGGGCYLDLIWRQGAGSTVASRRYRRVSGHMLRKNLVSKVNILNEDKGVRSRGTWPGNSFKKDPTNTNKILSCRKFYFYLLGLFASKARVIIARSRIFFIKLRDFRILCIREGKSLYKQRRLNDFQMTEYFKIEERTYKDSICRRYNGRTVYQGSDLSGFSLVHDLIHI